MVPAGPGASCVYMGKNSWHTRRREKTRITQTGTHLRGPRADDFHVFQRLLVHWQPRPCPCLTRPMPVPCPMTDIGGTPPGGSDSGGGGANRMRDTPPAALLPPA